MGCHADRSAGDAAQCRSSESSARATVDVISDARADDGIQLNAVKPRFRFSTTAVYRQQAENENPQKEFRGQPYILPQYG